MLPSVIGGPGGLLGVHSITSSANASTVGGIWRPSAFAVLRLMTSSNLVGCHTGFAGLVELGLKTKR
jgi:hypothetical protein